MAPKFSVILPFRNEERYLDAAIRSVHAQAFADWELLLVDDGSSDQSPRIAADWTRKDPRMTLLGHPGGINCGVASSRNLALNLAGGEFVTFLDGDDFYLPDRLSGHARILEQNPQLVALYGATQWLDEPTGAVKVEDLGPFVERLLDPPRLIERVILNHEGAVPCVCSITLRRDVAAAVGGFETSFTLYEDQTLWVKVFARHPTYVSSHCGAVYRQHDASTSAQAARDGVYRSSGPHQSGHRFLLWMDDYLRAQAVSDPRLRRSLETWLRLYDARPWVRWAADRQIALRALGRRAQNAVLRRTRRPSAAPKPSGPASV